MAEPILKWAGGKRQILPRIEEALPPEDECGCYHEPFFGGGALFFDTAPHKCGTINDINPRLMNFYRVVRDNPDALIETLLDFKPPEESPVEDRPFSETNRKGKAVKNYYYQQREIFNNRPNGDEYDEVEEAALLLYLNRTCFNGLYRENQDGEFNVPEGNYQNPNWIQSQRIQEASHLLENIQIKNEDFEYIRDYAEPEDLVYFDPPYRPVSSTSSFVEYSSDSFGPEEQKRLRDLVRDLHDEGVYVVMSNSPPVKELYKNIGGIYVVDIGAKRMINSNADDRGEVGEIIITNVPEDNRRAEPPDLGRYQEPSK